MIFRFKIIFISHVYLDGTLFHPIKSIGGISTGAAKRLK